MKDEKDSEILSLRDICEVRAQKIAKLEAENTELKHILFESIIAPNCSTCSNQMGKHCDNGIICMEKLKRGEFVNFYNKKLEAEVKRGEK